VTSSEIRRRKGSDLEVHSTTEPWKSALFCFEIGRGKKRVCGPYMVLIWQVSDDGGWEEGPFEEELKGAVRGEGLRRIRRERDVHGGSH